MIGMGFSQAGLAEALPGVKGLGGSWPYGTALFELSCRLKEGGIGTRMWSRPNDRATSTGRELIRDFIPILFLALCRTSLEQCPSTDPIFLLMIISKRDTTARHMAPPVDGVDGVDDDLLFCVDSAPPA